MLWKRKRSGIWTINISVKDDAHMFATQVYGGSGCIAPLSLQSWKRIGVSGEFYAPAALPLKKESPFLFKQEAERVLASVRTLWRRRKTR